jgi:ferredoxin-NADP reductase/ferredoxin
MSPRSLRERASQLIDDLGTLVQEQAGAQAMRHSSWGADHANTDWAGQARQAVAALHPERMSLELVEREPVSPTTTCLRFARTDGRLPPFEPGQWLSLAVELPGVRTARPYSISSAPGAPLLELCVRHAPADDGLVAPFLAHQVQPGWSTTASGPRGGFFHEPLRDAPSVVLVAGGSGIAPFMSMLRAWAARGWPVPVTLLYGSRHPEDTPFAAELRSMARGNPAFRVVFVYSHAPEVKRVRHGFIDRAQILHAVPEPEAHSFFLCGPEPMLVLVRAELEALGLPRRRVRAERFGPPADLTAQPGWPADLPLDAIVHVGLPSGARVLAHVNEPILVALERAGLTPANTCRTGSCGVCRVQLLSGRVFVPSSVPIRASDREHGFIHGCMAWPLEDVEIGSIP